MKNEIIILKYSLLDFLFHNGNHLATLERHRSTPELIDNFDQCAKKFAEKHDITLETKRIDYTDDVYYNPSDLGEIPDVYDIYSLYENI